MAKRPVGRPKSDRDDLTVKMDRELVAMAKYIATKRGMTVAEIVSTASRAWIEREYAKESKRTGG